MNIIKISLIGALFGTIIYLLISCFFCKEITERPNQNLQDILKVAKSGDMILFCTNDLAGRIIRFTSNDCFSHAAILFKDKNQWYIWDSDYYQQYDYISQKTKSGSKLRKLDEAIKAYGYCKAKLYPLKRKIISKISNWKEVLSIYNNSLFEDNPFVWYLADWKLNLLKNKKRNFCSELIADTYQRLGIFHTKIPSNLYTFKDLRQQHEVFDKAICFNVLSPAS